MTLLQDHAKQIYEQAIRCALPDVAVESILRKHFTIQKDGQTVLISVGKAAWQMASAALQVLPNPISRGLVITKYGHSQGSLPGLEIMEAGHPVVDEASFLATKRALEMVEGLTERDAVLFLLSGGGSALFESSQLPLQELQDINTQLLHCGANIQEINCIRKRLSDIKGGRFAQTCAPAHVFAVILSDVVGDRLDMIASGPTVKDGSTVQEALEIAERYQLHFSDRAWALLERPPIVSLQHVENYICGSVSQLCVTARDVCQQLGYRTVLLTDHEDREARVVGEELARKLLAAAADGIPTALILGGETVVHVTGHGSGGRNQELALAAAPILAGKDDVAVFSVGSDGTDGPTDAAGGFVDGHTVGALAENGLDPIAVLQENDAYHALEAIGGLIMTGPTGTNVNDLSVALYYPVNSQYK